MHYTDADHDSKLTEHALRTSEKILGRINEEIRAQESRDRLRELSQDLWIGNGCVACSSIEVNDAYALTFSVDDWISLHRRAT